MVCAAQFRKAKSYGLNLAAATTVDFKSWNIDGRMFDAGFPSLVVVPSCSSFLASTVPMVP